MKNNRIVKSTSEAPMLDSLLNISSPKTWYKRKPITPITHRVRHLLKRLIDIVLGILILIPSLPVLAMCGVAIKLESPGPMFFTQERNGKGGRRFKVLKLRTMVKDAASMKEELRHLSTRSYPDFKIPTAKDPRITKVGRFLRKTSLDELPQLFNVIKGDMSLVGPRPTSTSSSTYDLWQTAILEAKPGITGLAQISGRSNLDFDERVRLDIAYARNPSLRLYLRILLRTPLCILKRDGAE